MEGIVPRRVPRQATPQISGPPQVSVVSQPRPETLDSVWQALEKHDLKKTRVVWPGQVRLSEITRLARQTVIDALDYFQSIGAIQTDLSGRDTGGRFGLTAYRLLVPDWRDARKLDTVVDTVHSSAVST